MMQEPYYSPRGIYYRKNEFRPDRKTIVFLHGLSGSSSAWEAYEKALGGKYNIVTFDLRGHGKSRKYKKYEDYAVNEFVEDIHEIATTLQLPPFCLVSHSFGTIIALEFIHQHQKSVSSAIFLSPLLDVKKTRWVFTMNILLGWFAQAVTFFPFSTKPGNHINYEKYKNTGDWNIGRMFADISNTGIRIYFFCLRQIYQFHENDDWMRVAVPTLILHGTNDSISPIANGRKIAKMIKKSEFIALNGANHVLVLNNPQETISAIEVFLATH